VSLAIAIVLAILTIARFPNNINEIITLFFSAIVAIAAVFYTVLTSALVSETRKTREVQTDPKILVEVRPRYVPAPKDKDEWLIDLMHKIPEMNLKENRLEFDLVARNIGYGPAYDIILNIIENVGGMELGKPSGYENKLMQSLSTGLYELIDSKSGGIDYIGPNHERSFFFWNVIVWHYLTVMHLVVDKTVKIEVKYYKYPKEMRTGSENPFKDTYSIDFPYVAELIRSLIRSEGRSKQPQDNPKPD
jgi:hypothetical protein